MTASLHAVLVGVYRLSPGAMVRVGGGGSLLLPRNLRSLEDVRSVSNSQEQAALDP